LVNTYRVEVPECRLGFSSVKRLDSAKIEKPVVRTLMDRRAVGLYVNSSGIAASSLAYRGQMGDDPSVTKRRRLEQTFRSGQGTLGPVILKISPCKRSRLGTQPGLKQVYGDVLSGERRPLSPASTQLEQKADKAEWRATENNRRAQFNHSRESGGASRAGSSNWDVSHGHFRRDAAEGG